MSILIIDGQNFLHRARAGLNEGEFSLIYTFLRSLRALVGEMKPDRVIFVREGRPHFRYLLLPEYKANRLVEAGTPKHTAMADFHRQCDLAIDLLSKYFPISVMQHPDYECDDLVYNIIKNGPASTEYTVVSNDSDFVQLLQKFNNVKVYNAMKKEYVTAPAYDYVSWKALRGDGSDNIPGFPGIGDKRAQTLVENPDHLEAFFAVRGRAETFLRNFELISFADIPDEELLRVNSSQPTRDWDKVSERFKEWEFQSLLVEKTWKKFVSTFDALWEVPNGGAA